MAVPGVKQLDKLVFLQSIGFLVFRLTFNVEGLKRPCTDFRGWFREMHGLEHGVPLSPEDRRTWSARLSGEPLAIGVGVSRFFDLMGYLLMSFFRADD